MIKFKELFFAAKYSKEAWFLRRLKYACLNIFKCDIQENRRLKGMLKDRCIHLIANGPSLKFVSQLPQNDVIVCNHFWRHHHYSNIRSGFHVISDKKFLGAKDIKKFIENQNLSLVLITTPDIGIQLKKAGYFGAIVEVNYSGLHPVWLSQSTLNYDLTKVLHTGSTVIADFGFPLIKYISAKRVLIYGLDLDYGASGKEYAFEASNSVTEPAEFLAGKWRELSRKSVQRWIKDLEKNGVSIHFHASAKFRINPS